MHRSLLLLTTLSMLIAGCSSKGKKLPTFTIQDVNQHEVNSKDLEGKVTVIAIWATWCGPCIASLPELNELADDYRNDTNVVFLGMTDESREKTISFLEERDFNFRQIPNAKDLMDKIHGGVVQYYPEHIVIDKNMNIVYDKTEPGANSAKTLRKLIHDLK